MKQIRVVPAITLMIALSIFGAAQGRSQSISRRAPHVADDSTQGYLGGQTWYDVETGVLYQAASVAPSGAVWNALPAAGKSGSLPLDIAPVAAGGGAWGDVLLNSAYAGPAYELTRASDGTTIQIGFVGLFADTTTGDNFCMGTTCKRGPNTWYDQSGNGNNCVQATTAHQFNYDQATFGSLRVADVVGTTGSAVEYCALPNSVAIAYNNFALMTAFAPGNPVLQDVVDSDGLSTLEYRWAGSFVQVVGAISESPTGWGNWTGWKPGVTSVSVSGKRGQFLNDGFPTTLAVRSVTTSGVGATLGDPKGTNGRAEAIVIWPSGLSVSVHAAAHQALMQELRIVPQTRGQLVVDGDSITAGFNCNCTTPYAANVQPLLNQPLAVVDLGVPGDTCTELASNFAKSGSHPAALFVPGLPNNILTIMCGTNDIGSGGATAAQAYASLTSYIKAAQAAGYKVVASTILPFNKDELTRESYNVLIRQNTAGADAIADPASDPTIGCSSCSTNHVYFAVDDTHPLGPGQAILANYFANAINSLPIK